MRLAIIRSRYNAFGGAERFVALALRALTAEGVQLTLISRRWPGAAFGTGMPPQAVDLVRVDPFYVGSTWRDWSFARGAQRALRDIGADLVQSHERMVGVDIYRAGDGVHASWLERRARWVGLGTRIGMACNWHHRYLVSVERRMFADPRLRAVICNSQMVKNEIAERFSVDSERLHVIYNGVDLNRYEPQLARGERASMRARLGIAAQAPVLVFIGSGFARKGLADALAALAQVPSVHLVVVGHDKRAGRYQALAQRLGIASRCHFMGPAGDPRPWYGVADGLVLPTIYDPFPNVALEALACGLPVLVSDACGAQEIVTEGVNGYVVPAGHVAFLAGAIRSWLKQFMEPTRREELASAARHSVLGFDIAQMSLQLEQLYHRLLEEHGR